MDEQFDGSKERPYRVWISDELELIVTTATPDDVDEVFEFLVANYFPRDPLRQIHLYDESDETRRPLWKRRQLVECFAQPYSTVARNADGQIVAVMVFCLDERPPATVAKQPAGPNNSKDRSPGWIPRALSAQLHEGLDLFSYYNTDKLLHGCMGVVLPEYVKHGIPAKVSAPTYAKAIADGAGANYGEAYSLYSQKLNERWAFETLREIAYAGFEVDGVKPLAVLNDPVFLEHRSAKLMGRKFPEITLQSNL